MSTLLDLFFLFTSNSNKLVSKSGEIEKCSIMSKKKKIIIMLSLLPLEPWRPRRKEKRRIREKGRTEKTGWPNHSQLWMTAGPVHLNGPMGIVGSASEKTLMKDCCASKANANASRRGRSSSVRLLEHSCDFYQVED